VEVILRKEKQYNFFNHYNFLSNIQNLKIYLKMILELIKHDYNTLWLKLFVVSGAWGCVLLAILIDLYFGVNPKHWESIRHPKAFAEVSRNSAITMQ